MLILSQQLVFKDLKAVPLISASRWLVKRTDVTRMWWKENSEAKLTFGRRVNKQNLVMFLFTDLLAITKRKSDKHYDVVDYCPRNLVQLQAVDSYELRALSAGKGLSDKDHGPKAAALLTLLQSQAENKTVEWLLTFPSESERRAWSLAFCPPEAKPSEASEPGEKIYADWDCPEVEAVADYSAADDCTELA